MATAIDRYMGLEWLKKEVDAAHKRAKADAEEELAAKTREDGVLEIASKVFGVDAGTYHYSNTRKKAVVEYNLTDKAELLVWLMSNGGAVTDYALEDPQAFAQWWFERTGEIPDGTARVEYEEPAKRGPAKLYGFDAKVVEAHVNPKVLEIVHALDGSGLMLGDGDA